VEDDVVLDQLIALSLTTRERGALERVVVEPVYAATLVAHEVVVRRRVVRARGACSQIDPMDEVEIGELFENT
jgi:hypothetical protein